MAVRRVQQKDTYQKNRSSHTKKVALKHLAKFKGKHLRHGLLVKLQP